jgi:ABC-2 type transport system ATP-binding protein
LAGAILSRMREALAELAAAQSGVVAAVRVRELDKRYGAMAALSGVSLDVAPGAAFGLVGVNGAGKTTLLKCLLDLCAFDAGSIEIFGAPSRRPSARARLAYVPERFVPPHYLRCGEFLDMFLQLAGAQRDQDRTHAVLEELELERAVLERPVRRLSKGMTQKLGLAACFLLERDLYVLDEPMSGLDPAARVAVKSVLQRLHAEGRTLFFTSHVLADVEELCSSMAVLHAGRTRFAGAPADLRRRYGEAKLENAFMRCIRDDSAARA